MSAHGSIQSISIDGRIFPVAADGDATRKLGGFENATQANGDSSARIIQTRVPWMLGNVVVEIDDNRADQEYLQEAIDSGESKSIDITFVSGVTFRASGTVTGELAYSNMSGTAPISLSGGGKLEQ